MSEVRSTASAASRGAPSTASGFELRLERGGAHVRLAPAAAGAGLTVELLDLEVPEVRLPIDVGAGPGQFQNRLCELCRLGVRLEPELVRAAAARLDLGALGLDGLAVELRDGFVEVAGRLSAGPAFALRLGLVPGVRRGVTVVPFAARLFGPASIPAAALAPLATQALARLGLPEDPLPVLLRRLLVARGWKVPREGAARLALAAVTPAGVRLAWDRDPPAAVGPPGDPDLLAALEGAGAFQRAEVLLAAGDLAGAREALLADPAAPAHPFGADRLLSLLCLEERFHDEALDLAADWLARRPGFGPALAAEAWIRLARGEDERAALALVALAEGSVTRGERLAAAAAADAALALPGAGQATRQRAVDAALAVKRDHLPALRALRALARESGDRGAQLRAVRRLLAYAPGDAEKARAHAELGELLLDRDPPAARLHLDRALRLDPDDPESLATLARACTAAGEHLRAVRALDRLRLLRLEADDLAEAARLALQAGAIWEGRLGHLENAWLRYREAAELGPGAAEAHRLAASCAERLGRWAEAADHHAAALALLDRSAPGAAAAAAGHHLALADVAELRLDDPAGAATHLEAALASLPPDQERLARLAALYRRLDRPAELAATLGRMAPLAGTPEGRAGLLTEAGELLRHRLGRSDAAQARYAAALAQDPTCRAALDGMAAVAAARGDAPAERDALQRLLPLAADRTEEAALLDRLASACERAGDPTGAARAVAAARRAAPTRARLAAAVALARSGGDRPALAGLLDELARAAVADGDGAGAAAAWRERAELLETEDPGLALASLAEARALLPGDPGLLRRQAAMAVRAGDPGLALGALRALLAGGPSDAPALEVAAARAALAAGQPGEARGHAERALAAGAGGALDLLSEALGRSGDEAGRAVLLARQGRHLEAAALHEQAGHLAPALASLEAAAADPGTAADALRALIRLRAQAGDVAGTAAALVAAARLAGGREGAELALRAFQLAPSDEALDAAAAADPAFAPPRAERARRRAAADPAGALADAEAALAGEPVDPAQRPALLRLAARLALATGDVELGRRRLGAYCQLGAPDDADLQELAGLHRAAGDEDGLATALERRLTTAPAAEAVALRLELAPLLVAHGRDQDAVARWREALSLDRTALPALRALLDPARAAVLHDGERPALAALLARHPGATGAERAEAWGELARGREAAGDGAGAVEALAEAARLRGDDDEGLELRAEVATRAGDLPAAASALLARAGRAVAAAEPGAAERLVEAGLAALGAGLDAEGEAALRTGLGLHPEPEAARAALTALGERAARAGDAAAEAEVLAPLVPLLTTGERPARLLRLSTLRAAAGDLAGALAAAEAARTLAPRDLTAVRQARAAADSVGQSARVAELLAEEAALDEAQAGPLQLERARRLAALGRPEEADDAYQEALRRLEPDVALAAEQARHRRGALPGRPGSAPLEAFARRSDDPAVAARGYLAAAAAALQEDDRGTALRCARRAFGRRRDAPAEAGPLLARLLYEQGAFAEALVLHRSFLEAGFPGFDDADVVALCRQLAELAAEAGELELARLALDRLLSLRPQEAEAARARFSIDPDRRRAVAALAEVAGRQRSEASRAALLGLAGEAALVELTDRRLGERLFLEARREGARVPGLALGLARRRADATRAAELGPEALLGALQDAAEAAQDAGQTVLARSLLEEAVAEERHRGMKAAAARDLGQLEALHAAEGDFPGAAARAREAAELLRESGDLDGAAEALQRADEADPGDPRTLERLAEVSGARGAEGAAALCRALGALAERAEPGRARARALCRLAAGEAEALHDDVRAEATLRRALAESPGEDAAEEALLALLARGGRDRERARLLHERAGRAPDPAARAAALREASRLLASSDEPADRVLAAEAAVAAAREAPQDLETARAAARALLAVGRREEATSHLARVFEAWPADDEAFGAAVALARDDADRLDAVLVARAAAVPAEAAGCHRARADLLFATGRIDRAIPAFEAALQHDPEDPAALASLAACLADVGGAAAARDTDRRLAELAEARPTLVPASLEAESRYRLGLAASPEGPSPRVRADLERALWLAPNDWRADHAFEALAEVQLGLGEPSAALAVARARVERAAAQGDAADELVALEAGVALIEAAGAPGRDGAAMLDALLVRRATTGAPLEDVVALAVRAAAAWRSVGDEPRAQQALARAGLSPPEARPLLAAVPAPPAEPGEAPEAAEPAMGASVEQAAGEEPGQASGPRETLPGWYLGAPPADFLGAAGAEPTAPEPVAAEPTVPEPAAAEPVVAEPTVSESAAAEPVAAAPVMAEPTVPETVASEPVAAEPAAPPPVGEWPADWSTSSELTSDLAAAFQDLADVVFEEGPPSSPAEGAAPGEPQPPSAVVAAAVEPEAVEGGRDPRTEAEGYAHVAAAAADPTERAQAWLASAEALGRAGGGAEEIRAVLELACDADPDSVEPWTALAAHEAAAGDGLASARAYLAVSIRTEGEVAARAALTAARLFEESGRHTDAARAYRAANMASPGCVPPSLILAEEALATGDLASAGESLRLVDEEALPEEARAGLRHARALAADGATMPGGVGLEPTAVEPASARTSAEEAAARGPHAQEPASLPPEVPALGQPVLDEAAGPELDLLEPIPLEAITLDSVALETVEPQTADDGPGPRPPALHDDPVAAILREQADLTDGPDRAALLERLAGHLERSGRAGEAADALLEGLSADPGRAESWDALNRLLEAAPDRRERAEALRTALGAAAVETDRTPPAAEQVAATPSAAPEPARPGSTAPWLPAAVEPAAPVDEVGSIAAALGETPAPAPTPARPGSTAPWLPAAAEPGAPVEDGSIAAALAEAAPEPMPGGPGSTAPWLPAAAEPGPTIVEDAPFATGPAEPGPEPGPEHEPRAHSGSTAPWAAAAGEPAAPEPVAATAPGPAGEAAAEPAPPAAALSEPSRAQETSATGPGSTAPWAPLVQVPSPPEVEAAAEAGASAPEEEAIEITLEEPASLDEVPGAGGPGSTAPWIPVASSDAPAEPPSPSPDTGVGSGPAGPPEASPEPPPAPPPRRQRDRAAELLTLVREHAAAGNRRALASILDEAEAVLGVEALRHHATSLGRAAFEAGRAEAAYRWLSLAREDAPDELTVARDLSRAAEKTGRHAEEVALGALCADAIAHHDPLAAAARYRHFSQVLADRLGDLAGAITMLEKALALAPEDRAARRELWGLWSRGGDTRQQALEGWLEAARSDPADADALSAVADLAARLAAEAPPDAAARLRERSRLAASLAAFAAPGRAAPPLRLARTVPPDLRDLLALPGAVGPLGQLLGLLAPFLEPLFPADLARRGATPADRLAAPRAPVVREALEAGVKALGPRPHVCFLVDRPGLEILLENSQPPSLVVPAALEALPGPAVHFLAARALDLLGRGWALSGKFAPRDVGILLELACRFAGGDPPSLGLPAQRTAAFMEALSRSVPHSIAERARPLGAGAAAELAATDVRAVGAAIRQTGSRVALLVTGDPSAALSALLLLERHGPARPTAAQALEQPDLRDLAQLALSDLFLDLRVAVVG